MKISNRKAPEVSRAIGDLVKAEWERRKAAVVDPTYDPGRVLEQGLRDSEMNAEQWRLLYSVLSHGTDTSGTKLRLLRLISRASESLSLWYGDWPEVSESQEDALVAAALAVAEDKLKDLSDDLEALGADGRGAGG